MNANDHTKIILHYKSRDPRETGRPKTRWKGKLTEEETGCKAEEEEQEGRGKY
jgi:hypothetical protein